MLHKKLPDKISMTVHRSLLRSLAVLGIFLLVIASCQKQIETVAWFSLAQRYAEAHEAMLLNEANKKETALQDFAAREAAGEELLKVPGPSKSEIGHLLQSKDPAARKVALVNVMLRDIDDDSIAASIAESYNIKDDTHTKFFSVHCFAQLNDLKLQPLQNRLLQIFSEETDEVVIIAGLPVLTRLEKSRTKPIFMRYLKTGTDGLRAATIISLAEKQPDMLEDVRRDLERQGVDLWVGLSKWRLPERLGLPNKHVPDK
jgi:hypothetical protein